MEKETKRKSVKEWFKSLSTFKKGILIYSGVLVVLVLISQIVLWTFLSSYQQSLYDSFANNYVKNAKAEYWKSFLSDNIYGSDYSTAEQDVDTAYNMLFKDKKLTCRRSVLESKDEYQVFKVSNGNTDICNLVIEEKGSGAFGMARWKVTRVDALEECLESVNPMLNVVVPEGSSFALSGQSVTTGGEKTENPLATPFETEGVPAFVKYSLRAPCGDWTINASYDNTPLSLKQQDGNVYVFDTPGERFNNSIIVPEGAEVYVNDIRLTLNYISEKSARCPFINPLEQGLETAPKASVYTVEGLYNKPSIKVVYGDEELSCKSGEGNALLYPFNTSGTDYTLQVPVGCTVTVNGIDISGDKQYLTNSDVEYTNVSLYKEELVNAKKCNVYTLKGMLLEPDVKVTDSAGTALAITRLTNQNLSCFYVPTAQQVSSLDELSLKFARAMMGCSFDGADDLAANYSKVISYIRKDSPAHKAMKDAYTALRWSRAHKTTYNKLYADNFIAFADNAFMCDVHYDATCKRINSSRAPYDVSGVYRLTYVCTNGKWQVVEFFMLDEYNESENK